MHFSRAGCTSSPGWMLIDYEASLFFTGHPAVCCFLSSLQRSEKFDRRFTCSPRLCWLHSSSSSRSYALFRTLLSSFEEMALILAHQLFCSFETPLFRLVFGLWFCRNSDDGRLIATSSSFFRHAILGTFSEFSSRWRFGFFDPTRTARWFLLLALSASYPWCTSQTTWVFFSPASCRSEWSPW